MKPIQLAAKQAFKSLFYRARIGAVVEKSGRILAVGHNIVGKSTSLFPHRWNSIHAEQKAIMYLLKEHNGLSLLRGSTLYVTRILRNGNFANAKPCPICEELIANCGIKRVIYTISNTETEQYHA